MRYLYLLVMVTPYSPTSPVPNLCNDYVFIFFHMIEENTFKRTKNLRSTSGVTHVRVTETLVCAVFARAFLNDSSNNFVAHGTVI